MRTQSLTPELLRPASVELPTSRHSSQQEVSVLATLRRLSPKRALNRDETLALAERQADLLLQLGRVGGPPTPSALITELPRVLVRIERELPVSAATHWINGRWLLLINGTEPTERQRFSLCHEYKHCIDHRLWPDIYRSRPEMTATQQAELAADAFAAALLMPARWLRAAWTGGNHDPRQLTALFEVSQQAMARRLNTLGLVDATSGAAAEAA